MKLLLQTILAGMVFALGALGHDADSPAKNKPADAGPVVHEWGTFSTFSGSDGKNLHFEPYDNDLPEFVHGYQLRNSKAGPAGGTISLETPVIYFYADKPLTASVQVEFPKGTITEWYPQAMRSDHKLVWKSFSVKPKEELRLLSERKESRYYAARETDAAGLQVTVQENDKKLKEPEKFLFYRGVGTFAMPLSVRALSDEKFAVQWNGRESLGDMILLRVHDGAIRFTPFKVEERTGHGLSGEVQLPKEDSSAAKLGEALVKHLMARGLYEKEAKAMVKTWSSAWFGEEGTRVLYFLPDALTDELLPLHLAPRPKSLVRVLVGRHDVLTPGREKEIDSLVRVTEQPEETQAAKRNAAWQQLAKLGRYQGAAQREADRRLHGQR